MKQYAAPEHRSFEVEQAVLFAEHQETRHGSDGVTQARGDSRTLDTQVKKGNQNIVQNDVGHAPRHGADQGQGGFVGGNQIEGEIIHEQNRDGEQQVVAQVGAAVAEYR